LVVSLGVAAVLVATAGAAAVQTPTVLVARVDGPITPVVADYLTDAVRDGEEGGHRALLVELDTPGGLDTSMREIVQVFLGARTPVIVYVWPSGARATSAGALITLSAHVAAMAPGTTIGAATPVNAQTGETAGDKVINDAAAFAESIARERGRNTDFVVATVREGRAVTAAEAHRLGAVDLVSPSRDALLKAVDGRTVTVAVLLPTALVAGSGSLLAGWLAWRARTAPPHTGRGTDPHRRHHRHPRRTRPHRAGPPGRRLVERPQPGHRPARRADRSGRRRPGPDPHRRARRARRHS
jgi:membrane-bound ClpP family serine protease